METNIIKVKEDATSFLVNGSALLNKSLELKISGQSDLDNAGIILKTCQITEKNLEAKRIEITKPLVDFLREANQLFKDTAIPLLQAKELVKKKIVAFNLEIEVKKLQEQKKRDDEEKARLKVIEDERIARENAEIEKRNAEAEKLKKLKESSPEYQAEQKRQEEERQKRINDEEQKRIIEEKRIADEKIKADEETNRLKNLNVKGITKRFTFEVIDSSQVPVKFCSPDSKKINDAIKLGVRTIQGIRIFEVVSVK
jgi:glycerophosphoryl diester phosphodiesterase